jgi:hypothetical protein
LDPGIICTPYHPLPADGVMTFGLQVAQDGISCTLHRHFRMAVDSSPKPKA